MFGAQQEAPLQAAPVEQFLENYITGDQLACQVADWGPQERPRR
jgi:hypothetical protein